MNIFAVHTKLQYNREFTISTIFTTRVPNKSFMWEFSGVPDGFSLDFSNVKDHFFKWFNRNLTLNPTLFIIFSK